jgi:hypothetical protein
MFLFLLRSTIKRGSVFSHAAYTDAAAMKAVATKRTKIVFPMNFTI